jgi:hypothetical protein
VQVYHEKSFILPDVSRVLACLYEKDVKFETHTASYRSLLRLQVFGVSNLVFFLAGRICSKICAINLVIAFSFSVCCRHHLMLQFHSMMALLF